MDCDFCKELGLLKHAKSNWKHCHNDIVVKHISDRDHVPSAQGTDPPDITNNTSGSQLRITGVIVWISINFQTLIINSVDYYMHGSFWNLSRQNAFISFNSWPNLLKKLCRLLPFVSLIKFKMSQATTWTPHSSLTVENCFRCCFLTRFCAVLVFIVL